MIVSINSRTGDFLINRSENELSNIKYHLKDCHKSYILKTERKAKPEQDELENKENSECEDESNSMISTLRLKRRKSSAVDDQLCHLPKEIL